MNKKRYSKKSHSHDYNGDRLKKILKLLPSTGKLLEIGAWDGTTIKYYKKKFTGDVYGIDISLDVLKKQKKLFKGIKACDLNKEKIPYPKNFFDVIVCSEVIEHIYNTDFLLQDIKRVLKPDGSLIISTPNLASFLNRLLILIGWQPLGTEVSSISSHYGNPMKQRLNPAGHIRNFTYRAFCELVKAHGFSIKKKVPAYMTQNRLYQFIEIITMTLFKGLGSDMILKCKKK